MTAPIAAPVEQPIKQELQRRGKRIAWLARGIGYSYHHTWQVVNGAQPAGFRFRKLCALFLRIPEYQLFTDEEAL